MIRILVGTFVLLKTGLLLAGTAAIPSHDPELLSLRVAPVDIRLMGGDASQRLVVLGVYSDGFERDVTALSRIQVQNPSVATLVKGTSLTPRADGNTVVTADLGGHSAQAAVLVEESRLTRSFSFSRDIGGILTKRGCNASKCHGGVKGRGGLQAVLGCPPSKGGLPLDRRRR